MKNALIKAMEGGYEYKGFDHDGSIRPTANPELCLLDKDFWVCLGKSLGWGKDEQFLKDWGEEWLYHWHGFIDHLSQGKDPEDFFNNLTK